MFVSNPLTPLELCRPHCEYLKPHLDTCQAPFKPITTIFGMDLLVCLIMFVIGNGILDTLKTLAIYCMVLGVISIYLCGFKPFKNNATTLLYTSRVINLGCEVILLWCRHNQYHIWYHFQDTHHHYSYRIWMYSSILPVYWPFV